MRYRCQIHVFEPVKEFHNQLSERFQGYPQITCHPFGLGGRTEAATISRAGDRSSHVQSGGGDLTETIELMGFTDFVREHNISRINLLKLNIEGAEYELLEKILMVGWAENITDLQVQFHNVGPDSPHRRQALRHRLRLTHELTYDFYFVWENWRLKHS